MTPRLLLRPEPKFIKVFWIPESENPDDDKIYFFFREIGQELEFFENTMVSRIARICKVRGLGHPRGGLLLSSRRNGLLLASLFFS